jgi:hypothetical protein
MERQMASELRDRRLDDEAAADDAPFDHQHYGRWVRMELTRSNELARDGLVRRSRTYVCPSCSYELTETEPVGLAGNSPRWDELD